MTMSGLTDEPLSWMVLSVVTQPVRMAFVRRSTILLWRVVMDDMLVGHCMAEDMGESFVLLTVVVGWSAVETSTFDRVGREAVESGTVNESPLLKRIFSPVYSQIEALANLYMDSMRGTFPWS